MRSARWRRGVGRAVLALAVVAPLVSCSRGGEDAALPLVWADEFDGPAGSPPDPASWTAVTGGGGWGNQELQRYTDDAANASLDGAGHLVITALREPELTSARLTTQGKHVFRHGRLEVRARVPSGVGTWPAFWAMGADEPEVGWPASGEIDVMEHVGADPTTVLGTIHGPDATGQHYYVAHQTTTDEPLSAAFHTFAVDWTADAVTWSLDGESYATARRPDVEKAGEWVFDKPFYLLLNLAVGGTLGGEVPESTVFPQSLVVDHVRVYGTPTSGS